MRLTWPWLWRAALDWLAIAGAMWLIGLFGLDWDRPVIAVIAWIVGLFIIGTRQHALGVLGHDGAHGLICDKTARH